MTEWVIDANVAIRWLVTDEPFHSKAKLLLQDAKKQKVRLIGPPLLEYELESNLQRRLLAGRYNLPRTNSALSRFYSIGVQIETHPDMMRRAREIARQYRQERVYDALYAALADLRKCEFWTADRRFFDEVKSGLSFVKYLTDYA